jgi:AraC-like DNA-binding protein
MTHQINILVLTLGALQSLLVSLALLRQKKTHPSRMYLILFLLVVALQLAFKIVSKTWLWEHVRTVYMISYNFGYLIGPLIYLFFRSRRQPSLFIRQDILHFIPFVVTTIITLADELFGYIIPGRILYFIPWPSWQLVSMFAYGVASWKLISDETESLRSMMKRFLVMSLVTEAIIMITIAILVRNFQSMPDIRILFVVLTFLIYWISYKLFSLPGIFSPEPAVVKLNISTPVKYANSGLRPEETSRILLLLKQSIEQERVFLEHDLSLDEVARRLQVKKHHLSQVINEHYHESFTELITRLRLHEAQGMILDHAHDDYKIAAIAFDAGFSSVSSFTTMFKKRFGVSPSEFRYKVKGIGYRQGQYR